VFFISLSNYSFLWWGTDISGFILGLLGFLFSSISFSFSTLSSFLGLFSGSFGSIGNLITGGFSVSSGFVGGSFSGGGIFLRFFGYLFDFTSSFISSIGNSFRLLSFVGIVRNFGDFFFGLLCSFLDSFILFFLGMNFFLFVLGFFDGVFDLLGFISGFLLGLRFLGFLFKLLDSSFDFLLVFSLLSFSLEVLSGLLDDFSSSIGGMVSSVLLFLAWAGVATASSTWGRIVVSSGNDSSEDGFKSIVVSLDSDSLGLCGEESGNNYSGCEEFHD
jgi:hypothetical protein